MALIFNRSRYTGKKGFNRSNFLWIADLQGCQAQEPASTFHGSHIGHCYPAGKKEARGQPCGGFYGNCLDLPHLPCPSKSAFYD